MAMRLLMCYALLPVPQLRLLPCPCVTGDLEPFAETVSLPSLVVVLSDSRYNLPLYEQHSAGSMYSCLHTRYTAAHKHDFNS